MLNLHAILLMRRLRSEGHEGPRLAQALFDLMFRDLDRHLREWGVGDLSVGKHVKELAQSFFGRAAALGSATDRVATARAIEAVLRRNVYSEGRPRRQSAVARLAEYLLAPGSLARGAGRVGLVDGLITFARPHARS